MPECCPLSPDRHFHSIGSIPWTVQHEDPSPGLGHQVFNILRFVAGQQDDSHHTAFNFVSRPLIVGFQDASASVVSNDTSHIRLEIRDPVNKRPTADKVGRHILAVLIRCKGWGRFGRSKSLVSTVFELRYRETVRHQGV